MHIKNDDNFFTLDFDMMNYLELSNVEVQRVYCFG